MEIFCTNRFFEEFSKLIGSNSYSDLESEIISYFLTPISINDVLSGSRLNGQAENPYIKKRLGGKGGFRIYFYIVIKDQNVYLNFVHPKTGKLGFEALDDDAISKFYKDVLEAIKSETLFSVKKNENGNGIEFTKMKKAKPNSVKNK